MIHRTYVVKTPSGSINAFVDVCVQAPMGTRLAPVTDPSVLPPGTPVTLPPTGWAGNFGDAAYYEIRGRTLRLERLAGANGFTQRTNLGFALVLTPYGAIDHSLDREFSLWNISGGVQLSQSLLAAVGDGLAIPTTNLADPIYGSAQPVIRVFAPLTVTGDPLAQSEGRSFQIYLVHFLIAENKDEDWSPLGHA
jgi:hypothetical protein